MDEWISVKDRLPEMPREFPVLTWSRWAEEIILCISYDPELGWMSDNANYMREGIDITHWMPLPEPPGKEKNEKTGEVKEILDYLSEAKRKMTGNNALRGYRETAPYKRLISARIKEGHTIDDFKLVIDHKAESWKKTKFAEYLRPSTLFSATHFPEYLCEAEAVKKKVFSEMDKAIEDMI